MDRSNHSQSIVSPRRRAARLLASGLVAAAALAGSAGAAQAACQDGASVSCTADDGCAGMKYCEGLSWGECFPIEDCHAPAGYDPVGPLDDLVLDSTASQLTLWGWTFDQDAPLTSLQVNVTVDGHAAGTLLANQYRPDVGAAYPGVGNDHGYSMVLPADAAGKHTVCTKAINVAGGESKTLGCRTYNIEGKVTTTWGLGDVTRCVADPVQAINSLPTSGTSFGFTTSASSEGLAYSLGSPHLQGVARLAFGLGQHMVVSRSGSWAFYVVHMGAQGAFGAPFGGGVTASDQVVTRVGNDVEVGLDHAGGVQALGTLLAVANWNGETDDPGLLLEERSHVAFFDMSDPAAPAELGILGRDVLVSPETGAVAMARLANNRILLISGRNESNWLDFYVSAPGQAAGWQHRTSWHESAAVSGLADGDREFGDYQALNLVTRCGDGALFLVGTHKEGDVWGADWVDLFRVELYSGSVLITKVAKRHVDCDGSCNLDAAGGVYVAPEGRLIVYGTEHAANGPSVGGLRSVKARQF